MAASLRRGLRLSMTDSSPHSELVRELQAMLVAGDRAGSATAAFYEKKLERLEEQLEAERRDRKWWAANNSRERQRLQERYAEAVGYIRAHLAGNDADSELRWVVDKYEEDPVTKPANLPITEERPRDAGTSGATT